MKFLLQLFQNDMLPLGFGLMKVLLWIFQNEFLLDGLKKEEIVLIQRS